MTSLDIAAISALDRQTNVEGIRQNLKSVSATLPKDSPERGMLSQVWENVRFLDWSIKDLELHLRQANATSEASTAMLSELRDKFSQLVTELDTLKDDIEMENPDNDLVGGLIQRVQSGYDETRTIFQVRLIKDALGWEGEEVDSLFTFLTHDMENEDPADFDIDYDRLYDFRTQLREMVRFVEYGD